MSEPEIDSSQFWFQTHDPRLAHYEASWGTYAKQFQILSAAGAVLPDFIRFFDQDLGTYRGFIHSGVAANMPPIDLGRFAGLPPPLRLGVEKGKYVALPATRPGYDLLLGALDRCLDPGVDCVVEFGSGLGTNLARLRLHRPKSTFTYIGCEPTEEGRAAAKLMFASDPSWRAETRSFDYAGADLGFLGEFKRPIAFTSHSIEQVALLGRSFYAKLLASPIVACVHLEPVGWQRFSNFFDVVLAMLRDHATFARLNMEYRWKIDDARLAENAALWAAQHAYNIDLLRLVSDAEKRGEIALLALDYDVAGLNPFNPSSLIGWTRRR